MSLRLRLPRSIVWLTLWGFLSTTGLPLYESHRFGEPDDAACLTAAGKAGRSQTLTTADSDGQPEHCAVCHLLRAVGGSLTPGIVSLPVPATLSASARPSTDVVRATESSVRASRAPPSHS